MIWGSFFAGLAVMLFVGILVIALIPTKRQKHLQQEHEDHLQTLHYYWEAANKIQRERNEILRGKGEGE